jgi:hypothetical protein
MEKDRGFYSYNGNGKAKNGSFSWPSGAGPGEKYIAQFVKVCPMQNMMLYYASRR